MELPIEVPNIELLVEYGEKVNNHAKVTNITQFTTRFPSKMPMGDELAHLLAVFACLSGVAVLAFANGANDVPKGMATLIGNGSMSYRSAQRLGLMATLAGGVASAFLSAALMRLFSTGGITSVDPLLEPAFPIALVGGAGLWVLFASRAGLPVSTTHAIIGASLGAALLAAGANGVDWGKLTLAVAIPLLLGPAAAVVIASGLMACSPRVGSPTSSTIQQRVHYVSAITACAARSLNDTPKIVGVGLMLLGIHGDGTTRSIEHLVVSLTIAATLFGGWIASRHVMNTLAFDLADLDRQSGYAANSATAFLVAMGSVFGLPLSITHVSGAALVGAGQGGRNRINGQVLREVVIAWLLTVPAAAVLAGGLWFLVGLTATLT